MSTTKDAATALERIADANLSDPATDDLTVPLAIECAELSAKNADLAAALEPFVRHYEPWMERMADDDQMSVFARHTMGELRRARAAIGKARP
jgi:hypothetical protein